MQQFQDEQQLREYVAKDFRAFVRMNAQLMGYAPPEFHIWVAWYLVDPRRLNRKKCIYGFRLAAKTWLIRQYVLWRWLRCPLMQVTIQSSNDTLAKAMAAALKNALENHPFLAHLTPRGTTGTYTWNLHGVQPEQGFSLTCAGIRTSVTSSRTDIYIFDDPEPDEDAMGMHYRIIQAMSEAINILHRPNRHDAWFQQMGLPGTPKEELTQLLVIGQPHTETTVYFPETSLLAEDEESGHPLADADMLVIPALRNDGEWTWPYMMNQKFWNHGENRPPTVEEVKAQFPTSVWELQYMINPQYAATLGAVLHLGMIEQVHRVVEAPVLSIDPADSKEKGCEWGVCIGGLFESTRGPLVHIQLIEGFTGEAYGFLDEEHDFADPSKLTVGESVWEAIFDRAYEFGVKTIILEKNLKAARDSCKRFMRHRRIEDISVIESQARGNKLNRIVDGLEQPVNNGLVSCEPGALRDQRTRRQFTKLRHDALPKPNDRIDAVEQLVSHIFETADMTGDGSAPNFGDPLQFSTSLVAGLPGVKLGAC